ncbi:MAG: LysE family translocator [Halioglobus sp.]
MALELGSGLWLSLLGICLLGAMSPGPSLAVVISSTVQHGRSGGYLAAVAHGIGVALYGLLTVTGLALLITNSTSLYTAIQIAGAAYLIYMGIALLRSKGANTQQDAPSTLRNPATSGFLVAFLNPKLAVFMLALFSQFLQPNFGWAEKSIMVATVGITDATWYALIATLIAQPRFLATLRSNAQTLDRVFGVVLIVLALSVLLNAAGVFAR